MAKRFIDTSLFNKPFIRGLEGPNKLLWVYMFTNCNHAGIWDVELDIASIRLGFNYSEEEVIQAFGDKLIVLEPGSKWFLPSFLEIQYKGELNPENRTHKSVLDLLAKYSNNEKIKPLIRPLQGCKDKDKDKDKDIKGGAGGKNEPEMTVVKTNDFKSGVEIFEWIKSYIKSHPEWWAANCNLQRLTRNFLDEACTDHLLKWSNWTFRKNLYQANHKPDQAATHAIEWLGTEMRRYKPGGNNRHRKIIG